MPLHSLLPSSVWLSSAQVWRWFPASAVQGTAVMAYLDCITSVLPLTGGLQASKARHARSDLWLQPLAQHEALLPSAPPARSPHRKGGISSVAALAFSTDAGPRRRGLHHCSHGVFLPSTRCLPHKDVTARASASSASDQPLPSWTPQQQSSEALLTEPGTSTGTESHQDSLGISTQTTKRRSPSPAENPSAAAAAATVPLRDPGEEEAAGQAVDYLSLTDAELLRQCNVDTYRASGPGGQHRNKTESAVRLRHTPTGCVSQVRPWPQLSSLSRTWFTRVQGLTRCQRHALSCAVLRKCLAPFQLVARLLMSFHVTLKSHRFARYSVVHVRTSGFIPEVSCCPACVFASLGDPVSRAEVTTPEQRHSAPSLAPGHRAERYVTLSSGA